jgi:hypothetical protein
MNAPADDLRGCRAYLVFGVGLQNEVPDALVGGGVGERAEKRERVLLAIDGVLPSGEGHVAGGSAATFPDPESDEFEAVLSHNSADVAQTANCRFVL